MSGWPWRSGWTSPEAAPSALTPGRWRREWWFLQGRRTAGRRCTGCQLCRGSWPTGTACRTNQSSALKVNVLWHLASLFFCFCFFWPLCKACGILVPWPGIESPLHWKCGVLTTGLPGKSLASLYINLWPWNSPVGKCFLVWNWRGGTFYERKSQQSTQWK